MVYVDARGLSCPVPLMKAIAAFKQTPSSDSMSIVVDDEVAVENITRTFKEKFDLDPVVKRDGIEVTLTFVHP